MSERPGVQPVYEDSFSSEVNAEISRLSLITVSLGYLQRHSLSYLSVEVMVPVGPLFL